MTNPWEQIALSDYESHMSLDTVGQLQAMDAMMAEQLRAEAETVLIFGVAGGNGLRHVKLSRTKTVYGVDINPDYLAACKARYPLLDGVLVPVLADVRDPACVLPKAELAIANLFVEYVGCEAFSAAVAKVRPRRVSVGIQCDEGEGFVSDSPYLHVFDGLSAVHVQLEEPLLTAAMERVGYTRSGARTYPLPNGKALLQLDYKNR